MTTKQRKMALAIVATIAVAGTATGATHAISESELEARWALADFQQVEKPGWDPGRFGELAAEFGSGSTTVTAHGFALRSVEDEHPHDGLTPEERERRLALAAFQQVDKPDWDPARFAELAARSGG